MSALLEPRDLSLAYGGQTVIRDVNIRITPGEIVTIVGPNGAGKSSLIRACIGALAPAVGTVTRADRLKIGYVPQDCGLFHWLRTKDNIQFARHLNKFGAKPDFDWFDQLTERFDLTEAKDLWPAELSGGMTQRVAILRALQASPKILVLDEPFSAIDTENTRRVLEVLREYTDRGYGQTIISTHEVALISEKVDSIVSISQPTGVLGIDAVMQSA